MEQKTYPFEQHGLSIKEIDLDALYVLEKLRAAGFVAYLVGGSVRDLLLRQKPKDFDISTSAAPEEIKKNFRNCILIGQRFRLALIRFGKKTIEVSTFRSGGTESDELILRDNIWGTPEQDALRRDFTINGLFYDAATQTIIDYVGGYPDLEKKLLRTIGQPYVRFKQDPVRMLRLLKFQARFGFEVDPPSSIALLECRSEIVKSAPARVLEELLRMLESGASEQFFRLLTDHGLLHLLTPGFGTFMESEGEEVLCYLKEVDAIFHEKRFSALDRSVLLACLLFPIVEKHIQTSFIGRNKIPHLGEIHEQVQGQIDNAFRPFLQLPRRIRMALASVLVNQYRFVSLDKKKKQRLRIPSDPDFGNALKFLQLRACVEPALQKIWEEWNGRFTPTQSAFPKHKKRRHRRGHA